MLPIFHGTVSPSFLVHTLMSRRPGFHLVHSVRILYLGRLEVKNCGLQGFIEWKIANSIMQACLSILGGNQNLFELVIATCLFFSIVSLLAGTIPFYTVFQSISSVMFTNSSVNWIMQILSPLATGSSSLGMELVSLAAGLALTHALLSILFSNRQVH
jgi:hypothetical protein